MATDRQAGKLSFAVRYGVARTRFAARLMFALFCAALLLALFARYPPIPGVLLSAAALVLVARLALAAVNPKRILLSASLWLLLALLLTMAVREDWLPLR